MARPHPFYRSTVLRWCFIASGTFLAFALSPWSPQAWRLDPSLAAIARTVPLWIGSVLFGVYVVLLLVGRASVDVVADYLGLFLYLCALITRCVSAMHHHPLNPFFVAALFLTCALHSAAGRLALAERESG